MRKGFLRSLRSGARLLGVGALSLCASLACVTLLKVPISASNMDVAGRFETLQEHPNSGDVLRGTDSNKQDSMNALKRLATEQVLSDGNFLGKIRFSIDAQHSTYSYDLSPVPPRLVLSESDSYATLLEALIRTESLRRDFHATIPNDGFWLEPLGAVEQVVRLCVRDVEASQARQGALANQQKCSRKIEQKFEKLKELIVKYAAAHGLRFVQPPQQKDPAIGYRTLVKIEPPRAHVKVMTLLEYKKCQYFKTPKEQYRWNEILDPENLMIGWYHYRVEWPPDLNGPEEGDFEITKPSTLTFQPTKK